MTRNIVETFAHVPDEVKDKAVAGFVKINPHLRGIWFDDIMELILDSDSHLSIIGDVVIGDDEALRIAEYFAMLAPEPE